MADLAAIHRLATELAGALREVAESPLSADSELLSLLTINEGISRQIERNNVSVLSVLRRRGTFWERGYKSPAGALSDLLLWGLNEARRYVTAAEAVSGRVEMDGSVSPPRLPATAVVFTEGQARLAHVEVIADLLAGPAAKRLTDGQRDGVEEQLAEKAALYPPPQLRKWGAALIDQLDQDGPEPDFDDEPHNELHVSRNTRGPGGTIKGRFDSAEMFDAIAGLLDVNAAPRDADDHRTVPRRQAEALAEIFGYVLAHGGREVTPETGGRRPQLNVHIGLEDLEFRARHATLDFGGELSPAALRMLACDATVIPIVMNGAGQPLDVGRATRTIPDGLRRAVIARDRGCAHPGCDRPPSWVEIHHVIPWENGGPTSLDNLVALCQRHHVLVHHSGWMIRFREGLPEFIPPRWIDVDQVPRRNPQHDRATVAVANLRL